MAGGLAKQGMIPVVALYSTFLQRAYDQLIQDIAMLHLHVVIAIDRAGLVGDDGPTHHGVFDVGFLRQIPGIKILTPVNYAEQQDMLRWAVRDYDGPVAIRYPRGCEGGYTDSHWNGLEKSVVCHRRGENATLLTYGSLLGNVMEAADILSSQGIEATVLRLLEVSAPCVEEILSQLSREKTLIVVEEVSGNCGISQAISAALNGTCRVYGKDLGPDFVSHGSLPQLYKLCGLDAQTIADYTQEVLRQ